jgi:ligand-binding sensor domain-containing protein/serine phosphatase RsbU (regulator of sigma subunit)
MQKYVFICFIIFGLHSQLLGQEYNFAHYSLEEGLAQSEVFDIVQDRRGNIWVANNGGGISRFDGKKFINLDESNGLVNNVTRALLEDSKGNLWIVTPEGVSKYDGRTFTNFTTQRGFQTGFFFYNIHEDKQGKIIIAPFGNGNVTSANLYSIENDKLSNFAEKFKVLDGKAILSIIKDPKGNILINTNAEIYEYDGNNVRLHPLQQTENLVGIFALLHDSKDRLWFTHNGNLKFFDGQKIQTFSFPANLPPPPTILSMIEDKKHQFWFRYGNAGVVRYDGEKFTHFTNANGLSANEIRALYEDQEGNIWIGANGLLRFMGERFTYFTTKSGLTSNLAMTFYKDTKNRFWVGTGAGISKFENGNITNYFEKNAETIGRVKSFAEDSKGNLLVATRNGGILRLEGEQFRNINQELGINFNAFSHIFPDSNALWLGSWGNSLYKVQDGKTTQIPFAPPLNPAIFSIFKDSKLHYWVGTSNGVAVIKEDKIVRTITPQDGLNNSIAMQFAEDKWGRIWISTYNGGVNIADGQKLLSLQQKDGLSSNTTYFVHKDKRGYFWVGTQNGVDRITLGEKREVKAIKNYAKAEGFGGIECNGNACYEDPEGNLWFGTINGLYKYDPKQDKSNTQTPKIHFTKLKLFFQEVNWADSSFKSFHQGIQQWFQLPENLILPYDQNHLTFDFEALDYQMPTKVKYQWKLEGADKDWLPITDRQEATYANLQPNSYRFLLRACNGDGVWTETPTAFSFTIKPPFWQTWWFRTGLLSLFIGMAFTGVRIRLKSLELQKLELEKQVQERTAEVVKKSNEILMKNVELEQQKEEILTQNDQINQQHSELEHAFNEINQKNRDITASITYAKRIQHAILPIKERIAHALPEHFILFKPRDIVSGDFYWFSEQHDGISTKIVLAAIDCTGHGVPGAFMSLIGNELMTEIVEKRKVLQANLILNEMHKGVKKALKQDETENRDGMDMTVCVIDTENKQMQFAGAKNPLVYLQKGELQFIKGDRRSIGGHQTEENRVFTNHLIDIQEKTMFYLFSDGYQDQFGGENNRQLTLNRLKEILLEIHDLQISKQQDTLEKHLFTWQGNHKQIDDILLIGVRL